MCTCTYFNAYNALRKNSSSKDMDEGKRLLKETCDAKDKLANYALLVA